MAKNKKFKGYPLIILTLLMLFNANVRTIDILPDFIAYLIVMRMLTRVSLRAPYFQEAADAVKSLLIITFLKLPSQIFVSMVQSQNVHDNDIVVLSTLVFALLEVIFVIKAIKYLFDGLFYVGQRTNATSLITPFPVTKRKSITPEALRSVTYAFFIAKNLLVFLPEMLLLTKTVEIGSQTPVFNPATLYSEIFLLCFLTVTVLGIVWLVLSVKFLNGAVAGCDLYKEILSLADENERAEIATRERVRSHNTAMNIIIAASFLSIELVFNDFHNINLLPSFLFVSVLILGNYLIHKRKAIKSVIVGVLYCIVSVTAYALLIQFLENYGYDALIKSEAARTEYLSFLICSCAELLLFTVIIIFNCVSTHFYIIENTGVSPDSARYMMTDKKYHRSLMKKNFTYSIIAFLAATVKLVNAILKFTVQDLTVKLPDDTTSTLVTTSLPWFNLVVFASSVIFIGYSFYFFGTLKDEIKLKHNYTE